MVQNILSYIKKGTKAKEVIVILDNSEYTVTNVTRVLDKVQLNVEKVIPIEAVAAEEVEEAAVEAEEVKTEAPKKTRKSKSTSTKGKKDE
jgi:hypothetical protein